MKIMTITTQSDSFVVFSITCTPTVNDLLKARGIYLIILHVGVHAGCLTDRRQNQFAFGENIKRV